MKTPTKETAIKIIELLSFGLVKGLGQPVPGKMCVEAAVCYAMGQDHSDKPSCVSSVVRSFKITLNDANWSSNEARAKGLQRLAIAQLGSENIDEGLFIKELIIATIKKIVPIALRAAAKLHPDQIHKDKLEDAAKVCELKGVAAAAAAHAAARAANVAADAAADAAATRATAAARTATRATAAARATRATAAARATAVAAAAAAAATRATAAARATAHAAARAANVAADAAADACATRATAAANVTAAAAAAAAAAHAADVAAADEVLTLMAEIGVKCLQHCKSPGCEWLYLCDNNSTK